MGYCSSIKEELKAWEFSAKETYSSLCQAPDGMFSFVKASFSKISSNREKNRRGRTLQERYKTSKGHFHLAEKERIFITL